MSENESGVTYALGAVERAQRDREIQAVAREFRAYVNREPLLDPGTVLAMISALEYAALGLDGAVSISNDAHFSELTSAGRARKARAEARRAGFVGYTAEVTIDGGSDFPPGTRVVTVVPDAPKPAVRVGGDDFDTCRVCSGLRRFHDGQGQDHEFEDR